jgi:nucleoside phosphorylase
MRILVTFALKNEFAAWRAIRDFRADESGQIVTHLAEVAGSEVIVVLTGAGPRQARAVAAKIMSEQEEINCCISSGLAGALVANLRVGQVVAARSVFSERDGDDGTDNLLSASGPLLEFAQEAGATAVDRFYSADRVITRSDEKKYLGLHADAVEMESFEVMFAAAENGIPAIAVRSISDAAEEDLPLDMDRIFTDTGQVSIPKVLGEVVLHPGSVPGLVRLGQKSKLAATSLAHFLDDYIKLVSDRYNKLEANAAQSGSAANA